MRLLFNLCCVRTMRWDTADGNVCKLYLRLHSTEWAHNTLALCMGLIFHIKAVIYFCHCCGFTRQHVVLMHKQRTQWRPGCFEQSLKAANFVDRWMSSMLSIISKYFASKATCSVARGCKTQQNRNQCKDTLHSFLHSISIFWWLSKESDDNVLCVAISIALFATMCDTN